MTAKTARPAMGREETRAASSNAVPRTLPDFHALTRQPLRWMLPWAIVWILCGLALSSWSALQSRVELLGLLQAPWMSMKLEVAVHRAAHGVGPDDNQLQWFRAGAVGANGKSRVPLLPGREALRSQDGSFDLNLAGLRPASTRGDALHGHVSWLLNEVDGHATLIWTCGYAPAPSGAQLPAVRNLTDVPPILLPSVCRHTQ